MASMSCTAPVTLLAWLMPTIAGTTPLSVSASPQRSRRPDPAARWWINRHARPAANAFALQSRRRAEHRVVLGIGLVMTPTGVRDRARAWTRLPRMAGSGVGGVEGRRRRSVRLAAIPGAGRVEEFIESLAAQAENLRTLTGFGVQTPCRQPSSVMYRAMAWATAGLGKTGRRVVRGAGVWPGPRVGERSWVVLRHARSHKAGGVGLTDRGRAVYSRSMGIGASSRSRTTRLWTGSGSWKSPKTSRSLWPLSRVRSPMTRTSTLKRRCANGGWPRRRSSRRSKGHPPEKLPLEADDWVKRNRGEAQGSTRN